MDVQLQDDGRKLADVSDLFTTASLDLQTSAAGALTVNAVDPGGLIPDRLLAKGTALTLDGQMYTVAACEREYRGPDVRMLTWTAYSRLASALRADLGPSNARGVTPGEWIAQRVRRAGGKCTVQSGARQRRIVQERGQSALAVIESLAGDMSTAWVEHSNRLWVGTPWWALHTDGLGLPMWDVRYGAEPVLGLTARSTDADRSEEGSATLRVDARFARRVRPWHSIRLTGVHPDDAGLWLVSSLGLSLSGQADAVDLTLARPRRTELVATNKTTGQGELGGESVPVGEGGWIEGADRVWPRCSRTPRQAVAWARARKGQGYEQRACLKFVSFAFNGGEGLGGGLARYVWEKAPASAWKKRGDTNPPAGALVVWGATPRNNAGHVGISIGGGQMVNASGGRIFETRIAGFTGNYYGSMSPSFWTG